MSLSIYTLIESQVSNRVVILGGGLAGLTAAICLTKHGMATLLIEKKNYPFHRVCGEYVSNEILPFLMGIGIDPSLYQCPSITNFQLSSANGKHHSTGLPLGGFGISRYLFDELLYNKARNLGVEFLHAEVEHLAFENDQHQIKLKGETQLTARTVIGAHGKRSKIDKQLNREFIQRISPYMGVKYHVKTDFSRDTVALHNFKGGYCGINAVEGGIFNICYLTRRESVKRAGSLEAMEAQVLKANPQLAQVWNNADFIFEKPLVINEVSFATKGPVEDHILMCGDAAGMIAPLCGNGMAMAIRSAIMLSNLLIEASHAGWSREHIERIYAQRWNREFRKRLAIGRTIQKLFGHGHLSDLAVALLKSQKLSHFIISKTHGQPLDASTLL